MGLFDFLGGGSKVQPVTIDPRTDQRKQIDSFLANYIGNYGSQYQPGKPYNQPLTAPMSGFERQGLDTFLTQYLNAPNLSPNLSSAQDVLSKTLNGGFDPGSSPYYQALRDAAQYNRNKAIIDTNADLGARGKFFSTEALGKYGDINANTQNSLNLDLANLANQERQRQMAAVPMSQSLENYISGIPLDKAKAAVTIGSLPRTIEQSDLEAQYQDFLRKQKEGQGVISAAGAPSNATVTEGYPLQPIDKSAKSASDIGSLLSYLSFLF